MKIYPCEDADFYDQFINGARDIWHAFTGSRPNIRDKIMRKSVNNEKSKKVEKLPVIQSGN